MLWELPRGSTHQRKERLEVLILRELPRGPTHQRKEGFEVLILWEFREAVVRVEAHVRHVTEVLWQADLVLAEMQHNEDIN